MNPVCLVVPAYNEGSRLPWETFQKYLAGHPECSLMLVDDGSTDNTYEIFQKLENAAPQQVRLLRLTKNSGKAEAVRQGMLAMANQCEFVGFWDADLATPLEELDGFLREFQQNSALDICCGCRLERLGTDIRRRASRHYIGRLIATFISRILTVPFYDTQCGAKLFRASCVQALFGEPFQTRWLFDVEFFYRYILLNGRERSSRSILEYPLHQWHEVAGSKISWRNTFSIFRELFRIWRMSRKTKVKP